MNKAIVFEGGHLRLQNFSSPKMRSRFVIIEQKAFGVNYDDFQVVSGKISNPNKYGILGIEASGVIVETANDCNKGFKIGDRVCYSTFNPGAFIKTRAVHEDYLIPIPKYSNFACGACLLKGIMAYTLLGKIFIIKSPATIVLTGASGGIGTIITELATRAGIKVIGVTSSDSKIEYIKSKGAIETVNYKKHSVEEVVMHVTEGKGADFFFDCLGADSEDFAFKILKTRGFLISFGTITGEPKFSFLDQKRKSITVTRVLLEHILDRRNHMVETALAYFKSVQGEVVRPSVTEYPFDKIDLALLDIKNKTRAGQKVLIL